MTGISMAKNGFLEFHVAADVWLIKDTSVCDLILSNYRKK